MYYLNNLLSEDTGIKKISPSAGSFSYCYKSWSEELLERAMRLFVWKNTDEVPDREIEATLLLNGGGFVTDKYKKTLAIFNGSYSGKPTVYFDTWESYSVRSPKYSAILKIGKDGVLGRNNALMNSIYPIIHRYAMMLAHVEVTIINVLVNAREANGTPVASTEAQRQSIISYRNSLMNGQVKAILDPAFSTVDFKQIGTAGTNINPKDLMEVRQNLLDAYYNDIGVKTAHKKKGNMIEEEVNADSAMLLLNISDMLKCRKTLAEEVNKMYNKNWEVDIAPEIKGTMEEENEDTEPIKPLEDKQNDRNSTTGDK